MAAYWRNWVGSVPKWCHTIQATDEEKVLTGPHVRTRSTLSNLQPVPDTLFPSLKQS